MSDDTAVPKHHEVVELLAALDCVGDTHELNDWRVDGRAITGREWIIIFAATDAAWNDA